LYCDNNQLTTLPVLPPGIVSLYCRNNQLTTLPVLPDTLEYLEFSGNQLTTLPALPPGLIGLNVSNNPISRVTFPFHAPISSEEMSSVFKDTYLQYSPHETLAQYEARLTKRKADAKVVTDPSLPLKLQLDLAPPRHIPGDTIPGGPGYTALAAPYDAGKKKFGGTRRRQTRRRRHRKRFQTFRKK
jgi:hypothetical protein